MVPFIPKTKANIAIVDGRADDIIVNNLKDLNLKVIRTIKCNELQESVSYHPDIVMHPINYNTLIIAPNVYGYYEKELSGLGINLIKGETILGSKYPQDIAYNVGRLKDIVIHNFKYTDGILKHYFKKQDLECININQGYSKCSLFIVDDISGITADVNIHKKLSEIGYNTLLIEPGYIKLYNERYGFIGGTSGNYDNNTILLTGIVDNHPNSKEIIDFFKKRNKKIIYLSDNDIIDLGTIITLAGNC